MPSRKRKSSTTTADALVDEAIRLSQQREQDEASAANSGGSIFFYPLNVLTDKLQRDNAPRELEPANCSPPVFLALTILQVALAHFGFSQLGAEFQFCSVASYGLHFVGWFISSFMLREQKWFDAIEDWGLVAIILALYFKYSGPTAASARQNLVFGMCLVWALRLSVFLTWRMWKRGSDWRFTKLGTAKFYSLFAWMTGGTWLVLILFAELHILREPEDEQRPLGLSDAVGVFVFGAGLIVNIIADSQKTAFTASRKKQKTPWIESGLWGQTQHPNYLGEIVLHSGISIVASNQLTSLLLPFVSPIWEWFFLVNTSLMLLHKRADELWSDDPRYQNYKKRVPILFP